MDYIDKPDPQTFIAHHGIKGQKWGVRRFQNADGSLTKAGKERYNEQNSLSILKRSFLRKSSSSLDN